MKEGNVVVEKSYAFAIRVVKLYCFLKKERGEFPIFTQLVQAGTSIGANVEEAMGGSSRRDFRAKLTIAYKEARETKFWLRLLRDSSFIEVKLANSLIHDCEELIKILTSILNTIKAT